ncbi:nucleotidyl transferase AbiEii/AbiGii toxin family protein [Flavivirga sp. 57AJ16]|uniref:nucleotidyl transferase AbiEii/AbiGii toxin family protein n=1 Tax=Flavivirga sp. 57AJ16 TaxID=3025307 RepID=UPI002366F80C|nr:nucleotidyl transferase AbiEii/AbiGii toxin family protein [Flavivirga sp. 57AJ16]MDD7886804.1 nucleotidyl transferase AbiEii/AbiGii toxin family protein [Flavivirga sp. 57AJ16]
MPRLSVDVNLTYVSIEDRDTSMKNIVEALKRIKSSIEAAVPEMHISLQEKILKLLISIPKAQIKLEVNQTNRGVIDGTKEMMLCEKAQDEFAAFCAIDVVPLSLLYGGKICAALDRQHPRDLFDIKYLTQNEGFTDEIKKGFLLCLLGSNRPLHEMLSPNLTDQSHAMENHFDGMSYVPFSYEDFEETRSQLITAVKESLTKKDKDFLLSFKSLAPDWSVYDFERFPAVQWKLQNLIKLKSNDLSKYNELVGALKNALH